MNAEETRALRRMNLSDLRLKAEAMGITVDKGWGQPKLVSVISKHASGTPAEEPQGAPTVVADGDQNILVTTLQNEDEEASAASSKARLEKLQAEASADLMRRQTELMQTQHARITGTSKAPVVVFEAPSTKAWNPDNSGENELRSMETGPDGVITMPPVASTPKIKGSGSMLMGDDELLQALDSWARGFVSDFERVTFDRSVDTLMVDIVSRHGLTKLQCGGVTFNPPGVAEALAYLRKQAEG